MGKYRGPPPTPMLGRCKKQNKTLIVVAKLKNVTIILHSNTRNVQIAEFPEISHLLNQHHSSLARHINATSRKSLKIQA